MKKLLTLSTVVALIALAQTTIPLSSIRALGNGSVLVLVDNSLRVARLEGLTVDTTGEPVLRVTATGGGSTGGGPSLGWYRSDYKLTASQLEFGLPGGEKYNILVYRNGLLMSVGNDYAITGSLVRFVAAQTPGPGDVVILRWQGPAA